MLALPLLLACFEQPPPEERAKPPGTEEVLAKPPSRPPGGDADGQTTGAAPRITGITFEPRSPKTTEPVTVSVEVQDRDSPRVDTDVMWVVNGQNRPDLSSETLDPDEFQKGDKLAVVVTARDGEHEVSKTSSEIVVANSPPTFTSDPRNASQLNGLTLNAEDPDGDPLSFSISGAPAGMSIDPKSGRIAYQGSEDEPGGDYNIVVTVDDGDHGQARWELSVGVSPGSKAVEAQKAKDAEAAGGTDQAEAG